MIACEYTDCSFYPCIKILYLGLIASIYLRTEPIPTLVLEQSKREDE